MESWTLLVEKLVCSTTDNGSNTVAAVETLDWVGLSCFGHNLHLVITNSFKDDARTTRALGICCKLVGTFARSCKKKRELPKA